MNNLSRVIALIFVGLVSVLSVSAQKRLPVKQTHEQADTVVVDLGALSVEHINETGSAVVDSIIQAHAESPYDRWEERDVEFNPDPTKAIWYSALLPGLGQVYNRRYWKLPIIVGGYLGLAYATSWNNGMLNDYTRAYRDIMDNDPDTKSYMDFFPPNTQESDLDKNWLTNVLQSRKNYYRRNRDLCIISMVGVYLIAMVDAYVDASLSHFDITPDLSMDWAPSLLPGSGSNLPGVGMQWVLTF